MTYAVIRHSAVDNIVVFMKALDDGAVYFKNKAGNRQWIINIPTSTNARGGDIAFEIKKQLRAKGLTAQTDEVNKAAQSLLSAIKHSAIDDPDIIDISDEYLEHHGILGMKWGVRRYQNKDGSLTLAGKKHYAKQLAVKNTNINYQIKLRSEPKLDAEQQINKSVKKYLKHPSDKKKELLTKEINQKRTSAAIMTSLRDFSGHNYGMGSVFSAEIDYDKYSNHIREKYGQIGLDQVNEYIRANNINIGTKNFDAAANNLSEYNRLYKENQELLDNIYKKK